LVCGLIQSSFSMRALSAVRRLPTRASICALASGEKVVLTYSWPRVSPAWPLRVASTRFQRGRISFWPRRVWFQKAKFSSTNGLLRYGLALSMVWKRRYACQAAGAVSASILDTSWWKAGMASENICGAATPWDLKNSLQDQLGVNWSACSSDTGL